MAGTVQEERGLGGARTAAQFTRPDWFMALDVALAEDTPEYPLSSKAVRLGGGAVISLGDFLESPRRNDSQGGGKKGPEFLEMTRKGKSFQVSALNTCSSFARLACFAVELHCSGSK